MAKKTIEIDEKAVYEKLLGELEDTYTLCHVDYRDEIPAKTVQECLDKGSSDVLFDEDLWEDSRIFYADQIITDMMEKEGYDPDQIKLFKGTGEYLDLRCEIESRDDSTPERDACRNTAMHAYVRFHSNYDCWLPMWEQGGIQARGTALAGIMAALSLNPWMVKQAAARRGIETFGPFRNLRSRNGNELVDYDKFIRVLCETPNYGNWSFFGKVDLEALLDNGFRPDGMTIPAGTTCAMFNWWNGGGSLDFCKTLRPVTVKELRRRLAPYHDDLKVVIDEKYNDNYGYTPCNVYGGHVSSDECLAA